MYVFLPPRIYLFPSGYGFLALGQSVGSLLFPCIADLWGFEQGRHILAIAGAAAGFACIWAVTPVRREPQKKPN